MKCPVCDVKIEKSVQKCPNCGFADLRTEFINQNELEMWKTYVVYPCRFAYETSKAHTKNLQEMVKKELSAIKEILKDQGSSDTSIKNDVNTSTPSFKKLTLNKNDEWVTKGNIAYKNYYKCKYSSLTICEVSNMIINTSGRNMTADFFVKKTYDSSGNDATTGVFFKWKLKDDYGIIVADGSWANTNMQIGDVIKDSLSVSGLDPSTKYVLEIINW